MLFFPAIAILASRKCSVNPSAGPLVPTPCNRTRPFALRELQEDPRVPLSKVQFQLSPRLGVGKKTTMPRSSSISSTRRRLSGKRKYNHTACAMIAGGNRWRL